MGCRTGKGIEKKRNFHYLALATVQNMWHAVAVHVNCFDYVCNRDSNNR